MFDNFAYLKNAISICINTFLFTLIFVYYIFFDDINHFLKKTRGSKYFFTLADAMWKRGEKMFLKEVCVSEST